MNQVAIQQIILQKFEDAKKRNSSWSIRAFAKRLEISPSTLSSLLNGKRKISRRLALSIARALDLNNDEITKFMSSFSNIQNPNQQSLKLEYVKLQMDQYKVISSWYHFAILSLIKTKDFQDDPAWIAKRLGIPKQTVSDALERLISLGILFYDNDKNLKRSHPNYTTSDDIVNFSLRKAHKEYLNLAAESLEKVSLDQRDLTYMTMAINPENIPEAKQRIREFEQELCSILGKGEKKEVYNVCVQLFPLTVLTKNNDQGGNL